MISLVLLLALRIEAEYNVIDGCYSACASSFSHTANIDLQLLHVQPSSSIRPGSRLMHLIQSTPGHLHPREIRTSTLRLPSNKQVVTVVSNLPCICPLFVHAACRMSAPYQTHAASTD